MAAVAMVTKVQKMLNSNRTAATPLFWFLGFHGNAILNFINTPKASTHYGEYSYDVS
jgi:cellobiose-specific phosphotransferase system component IIC